MFVCERDSVISNGRIREQCETIIINKNKNENELKQFK